jgi:ferric-dicitrate binding protein FerR (iron transport regulator)
LTRLSLDEIFTAQNGEQVTLNLRAGRIRANVRPPTGGNTNFTVRSPTATASVRGTVFDFDGIRLQVEEGRVYLTGTNASGVYISTGHEAAEGPAGKIATTIETIKESLSPALPAGMDTVPPAITAAPVSANLDIRFDWSRQ